MQGAPKSRLFAHIYQPLQQGACPHPLTLAPRPCILYPQYNHDHRTDAWYMCAYCSWKQRPDDALEVVEWANSHDADAARIAAAGQELAKKYLNGNARTCYW